MRDPLASSRKGCMTNRGPASRGGSASAARPFNRIEADDVPHLFGQQPVRRQLEPLGTMRLQAVARHLDLHLLMAISRYSIRRTRQARSTPPAKLQVPRQQGSQSRFSIRASRTCHSIRRSRPDQILESISRIASRRRRTEKRKPSVMSRPTTLPASAPAVTPMPRLSMMSMKSNGRSAMRISRVAALPPILSTASTARLHIQEYVNSALEKLDQT